MQDQHVITALPQVNGSQQETGRLLQISATTAGHTTKPSHAALREVGLSDTLIMGKDAVAFSR